MAPSPCAHCGSRALIIRPKNQQKLCKDCFLQVFEDEIHHTIITHRLFQPGERIAIGASGGKDSTVLAAVLARLNAQHHYGLDLQLLSIDEGIAGYRDASLAAVARHATQYGLPLRVVAYADLYGWTMDQVVAQQQQQQASHAARASCTFCGVFRRQALDRGAALLGARHVVTGHNADDIAETVLMNLLRGDLPRLARATRLVTASAASTVRRSKPLKYAYEKEIVLYAHHRRLDYFSTECVYSPEAFRGTARTLVKSLERLRPSAILDIVRSGEDMARLVPAEVSGVGAVTAAGDDDRDEQGAEGCGSTNGRGSGGEMAAMEKLLRANDASAEAEVEIVAPPVLAQRPLAQRGPRTSRQQARKLPSQQLGKCSRCGYLSSQELCKACVLLEGLNKNRPKMVIEVGDADGEAGPALTRRMGELRVLDG